MFRRSTRPTGLLAAALLVAACGGSEGSPGAGESPATSPAAPEASPATPPAASPGGSPAESPAGDTTEIVGVDYAYENVPDTTTVGTTFTFRNDGGEVHEMLVVRRNPDATQTWEELLALPQEEAEQFASVVGNAFAEPGETAQESVTLTEPGAYAMVCFIPTGTTEIPSDANATLPPGPPHFTQGMIEEFVVEEG